jgi:hypothetical protein
MTVLVYEKASGVPDEAGVRGGLGSHVISRVASVGWSVVRKGAPAGRAPSFGGQLCRVGRMFRRRGFISAGVLQVKQASAGYRPDVL